MTSLSCFFLVIIILSFLFLALNFYLAPHNPYEEKYSIFECGYHSFLGQSRIQVAISFFIFGFLFLIFDLEIVMLFPYAVSIYDNGVYGLTIVIIFIIIISIGFIYEFNKKALNIESKQNNNTNN